MPRCGPVPYEEQTKEANGDLEAEQLLRLSSVTKCRSRIMGLCFGGAATGPPCEACRRSCWGEQRCMVSLLLLCGLCNPCTMCPASLMVCYRTCGPRCKSSQFGVTPRCVVPAACAATLTDLEIWNGGREQCEGVRRGRSCVQHPHADAGCSPLHDDRVLLPWGARVTS